MSDQDNHLLAEDDTHVRGVPNPFAANALENFDADNFHTLASHFSHLNPPPFNGFSQQTLQALGQQTLPQHPLHPPVGQHEPRSSSLPVRFTPQAGLFDPNPNSLLNTLRAHGDPSHLLGLHHQAEALQQQPHNAILPGRLTALKPELPEREGSDASLSGPPRQLFGHAEPQALPARLNSSTASLLRQASGTLPQPQTSGYVQQTFGHATLEELRAASEKFAADRDWDKFHSPRNLLLALVGEVGELAELFQWRMDPVPRGLIGFTSEDKRRVGEEMSDVLLYLIRMADCSGIDLASAVHRKMQLNAEKYPPDLCRGSSAKYHLYSKGSDLTDDQNGNKRKRFSDEQLSALTDLAEEANWSLLSVAKEVREHFCLKHEISKERLHNFFNNRKPKDLKKRKTGSSDNMRSSPSLEHASQGYQGHRLSLEQPPSPLS